MPCALGFEEARERALALAGHIAPELELRAEGFVGNVQAYSEALIARGDGLTAMPGAAVPEGVRLRVHPVRWTACP